MLCRLSTHAIQNIKKTWLQQSSTLQHRWVLPQTPGIHQEVDFWINIWSLHFKIPFTVGEFFLLSVGVMTYILRRRNLLEHGCFFHVLCILIHTKSYSLLLHPTCLYICFPSWWLAILCSICSDKNVNEIFELISQQIRHLP